jgi:DNA-binding winged helix-turn-helix (wHTH) protein
MCHGGQGESKTAMPRYALRIIKAFIYYYHETILNRTIRGILRSSPAYLSLLASTCLNTLYLTTYHILSQNVIIAILLFLTIYVKAL